jgi:hypothetical protein
MSHIRMKSTAFSALLTPFTDGVAALRDPRGTLGEAHE